MPGCMVRKIYHLSKKEKMFEGWGATDLYNLEFFSNKLLEVEVPVVSNTVCAFAMLEFTVGNAFYSKADIKIVAGTAGTPAEP